MRNWSKYQQDVFQFIREGRGSAVVEAVAGSGKTTTIVEAMKMASGRSIFLAFNKAIAEELKSRGCAASTFHSAAFAGLRKVASPKVDANKIAGIQRELWSYEVRAGYGAFTKRLVGLAKGVGIGCKGCPEDHPDSWMELVLQHDIGLDRDDEKLTLERGFELCSELLWASNQCKNIIDFDDMLYLPVLWELELPKYDVVFVDEAQDTNAIQREILRKLGHARTRYVAVGDPHQAIYGFRGSDNDSLARIKADFGCVTLPLSISYRCPQKVVEYAQQWVKHIQAHESAPEGEVLHLERWGKETFRAGDMVVCRTTAPVVSTAFRLIRSGIPATVMGREIGAGLKALIKKLNVMEGEGEVERLKAALDVWAGKEIAKLDPELDENKIKAVEDKAETIVALCDGLDEGEGIEALMSAIDALFEDKRNAVILCTIHKSKGLEAERVFWLNRSQCPATWPRKKWQKDQEINLCYVAATRAKNTLVTIEEGGWE